MNKNQKALLNAPIQPTKNLPHQNKTNLPITQNTKTPNTTTNKPNNTKLTTTNQYKNQTKNITKPIKKARPTGLAQNQYNKHKQKSLKTNQTSHIKHTFTKKEIKEITLFKTHSTYSSKKNTKCKHNSKTPSNQTHTLNSNLHHTTTNKIHTCINKNKKHPNQSTNLAHNHRKTKHNKITKHFTQNPEMRQSPSLPNHIPTYLKEKIKKDRPKNLIQHQTQTQSTNPTTPKHIINNKRELNKQHTNTYTMHTKQQITTRMKYKHAHINIKRIKIIINKASPNTPKPKRKQIIITQQKSTNNFKQTKTNNTHPKTYQTKTTYKTTKSILTKTTYINHLKTIQRTWKNLQNIRWAQPIDLIQSKYQYIKTNHTKTYHNQYITHLAHIRKANTTNKTIAQWQSLLTTKYVQSNTLKNNKKTNTP